MVEIRLVKLEKNNDGSHNFTDYFQNQLKYNTSVIYDGLEALLSQGYHVRCTGRSTLIAMALVLKAWYNPYTLVEWTDHYHINGKVPEYAKDSVMKLAILFLEYGNYLQNDKDKFVISKRGVTWEGVRSW